MIISSLLSINYINYHRTFPYLAGQTVIYKFYVSQAMFYLIFNNQLNYPLSPTMLSFVTELLFFSCCIHDVGLHVTFIVHKSL